MVPNKKYCPEQSDKGHSLLSFMKLASTKVKTALEKPNSFKRNINHRRFLQKQFKTLVKGPDGAKVPALKQQAKANGTQAMHYRPYTNTNNRHQLPPSPVDVNDLEFAPYIPSLDIHEQVFADPLVSATSNNSCEFGLKNYELDRRVPDTTSYAPLPELGIGEDDGFLTGEELTQAIELKDLFIPETDLTQYYLNVKENFGLFRDDAGMSWDFDSWIEHDFLGDELTVF